MVTLFGALPPSASRWSVPTWLLSTTGPKLGYMAKVAKKRRRNRRAILYFNFLKCAFVVNQSFKVTDNIQMLSTKSARAMNDIIYLYRTKLVDLQNIPAVQARHHHNMNH